MSHSLNTLGTAEGGGGGVSRKSRGWGIITAVIFSNRMIVSKLYLAPVLTIAEVDRVFPTTKARPISCDVLTKEVNLKYVLLI